MVPPSARGKNSVGAGAASRVPGPDVQSRATSCDTVPAGPPDWNRPWKAGPACAWFFVAFGGCGSAGCNARLRELLVLRCQQSVDLACAARGTPVIEEDGGVGPGRLREHGSGGACGIARRGIDQIHGAARPEEVSDIEVSGARFASQRVRQMGAIALRQCPGELGRNARILAQGEDLTAQGGIGNAQLTVGAARDSPWLPHPGQSGGLRSSPCRARSVR